MLHHKIEHLHHFGAFFWSFLKKNRVHLRPGGLGNGQFFMLIEVVVNNHVHDAVAVLPHHIFWQFQFCYVLRLHILILL